MRIQTIVGTAILGVALGASVPVLSSCDTICAEGAQPSVVVRVYDADGSAGSPLVADDVRFKYWGTTADNADFSVEPPWQDARCFDSTCTEWMTTWEKSGQFEVQATVCGKTFTAAADVDWGVDGCHVETEYIDIVVGARDCIDELPIANERKSECDMMARPSVIVHPVLEMDDYYQPVALDELWYEHDGNRYEAECVSELDGCTSWIAGYELAGRITLQAEYCDTWVDQTVTVDMMENGCHVETEFAMLPLETRGCLAVETPSVTPTVPR